VKQEV